MKLNLYAVFPVLSGQTHKLTPDLHSPAPFWEPVTTYHLQESITALCEMSDSTCRVLSVAFASQCSDLTSSLSPQCSATAWIRNQPLKRCSFLTWPFFRKISTEWEYEPSHWPCLGIVLAHMSLSFLQQGNKKIFYKKFCFIISVIVQCHFGFHGQIAKLVLSEIFGPSQKEILFHFTAKPHTLPHCSVLLGKRKVYITSSQGYNRLRWKHHPVYKKKY